MIEGKALTVIAELRIPDHLSRGPADTVAELSATVGADKERSSTGLAFLVACGLLGRTGTGDMRRRASTCSRRSPESVREFGSD